MWEVKSVVDMHVFKCEIPYLSIYIVVSEFTAVFYLFCWTVNFVESFILENVKYIFLLIFPIEMTL